MTSPQKPYGIWVEFNDLTEDGTVVVHADFAELAELPKVGDQLTTGDDEGNRCPAAVAAVEGTRITLKLDLDRFQAAPFERPAQ